MEEKGRTGNGMRLLGYVKVWWKRNDRSGKMERYVELNERRGNLCKGFRFKYKGGQREVPLEEISREMEELVRWRLRVVPDHQPQNNI